MWFSQRRICRHIYPFVCCARCKPEAKDVIKNDQERSYAYYVFSRGKFIHLHDVYWSEYNGSGGEKIVARNGAQIDIQLLLRQ